MTAFGKNTIIEKLSECMGMEKARSVVTDICVELELQAKSHFTPEEMIRVCERMETEGGFLKMMASVIKIQALMESEID